MKVSLTLILFLFISPLVIFAQLGDRKDKGDEEQIDPISTELIPPSPFLTAEASMDAIEVADGFVLEEVAAEPWVENPIAMAFDANGRMWVVEMRSYMPDVDGTGEDTPNGRIRVLEDTDNDGQIDKATDFLDNLVLPRVVSFSHGGVIFNSGDALYFVQRDGLKPKGERELIDPDYAKGGNPEHKANGMMYGHDNWFYNTKSSNRYRRIDGKWIKERTSTRGQFGITKDNAGRLFYNSNSTLLVGDSFTPGFLQKMRAYQVSSNQVHPSRINPGVNRAYRSGTLTEDGKLANATAACGPVIYRGDNFPETFSNYAFVCESSGNLVKAIELTGLKDYRQTGTHPYGENEFLTSTDERFRPVNAYTAPDGTLLIVDMYHGLIQHKAYVTSYLRKQYLSRGLDKQNNQAGRIYRVRWEANERAHVPKLENKAAPELLPYLNHPNGFWRDTAQRLIVESKDRSLIPELVNLAGDHSSPLGQIHSLWTLEGLGQIPASAIKSTLSSSNPDVRMTALELAPLATEGSSKNILAACIQATDTTQVYKARCLARLGSIDSWSELLKIIDAPIDSKILLEIIYTAVGDNLDAFQRFLNKRNTSVQQFIVQLDETVAAIKAKSQGNKNNLEGKQLESFRRGKVVYEEKAVCMGCHGMDGEGLLNLGPPLATSDWVTGDPERLIRVLLHGMEGPVTVNGTTYTPLAVMPGLGTNPTITDQDLADVSTFVRNSWGNSAPPVKEKDVAHERELTQGRGEKLYREEDFF
jgi:glucose/arabinose dehydrogenase/mono/diheme cytochrome c family protein